MRLGRDQAIHESVFKKFYSDNYDTSRQHSSIPAPGHSLTRRGGAALSAVAPIGWSGEQGGLESGLGAQGRQL